VGSVLAGPGLAADDDAHGGWRRFPLFSLMTKKETGGKKEEEKAIYVAKLILQSTVSF